jgi:hypothetical protein
MVALAVYQTSMATADIMVVVAAEVLAALGAPAPEATALGATGAALAVPLVAPV